MCRPNELLIAFECAFTNQFLLSLRRWDEKNHKETLSRTYFITECDCEYLPTGIKLTGLSARNHELIPKNVPTHLHIISTDEVMSQARLASKFLSKYDSYDPCTELHMYRRILYKCMVRLLSQPVWHDFGKDPYMDKVRKDEQRHKREHEEKKQRQKELQRDQAKERKLKLKADKEREEAARRQLEQQTKKKKKNQENQMQAVETRSRAYSESSTKQDEPEALVTEDTVRPGPSKVYPALDMSAVADNLSKNKKKKRKKNKPTGINSLQTEQLQLVDRAAEGPVDTNQAGPSRGNAIQFSDQQTQSKQEDTARQASIYKPEPLIVLPPLDTEAIADDVLKMKPKKKKKKKKNGKPGPAPAHPERAVAEQREMPVKDENLPSQSDNEEKTNNEEVKPSSPSEKNVGISNLEGTSRMRSFGTQYTLDDID